ncbi:MAG TPA: hypothetical protein VHE61_22075 [Opitutaceae bacterium]|nr:hypothetical protein [Opitutaceae bacterium]
MKKSYLYFIIPVVCTVVFAVYYSHYSGIYNARLAHIDEQKREERQKKLEDEAKARDKAIKEALATQELRKKQKAERDAREAAERAAREKMGEELSKAREDERKYSEQVRRLQKDVQDSKDQIAKIQEDQKSLVQQAAFLRTYVKQAEGNQQSLMQVLQKIDDADKARAAAEKAAAKKS